MNIGKILSLITGNRYHFKVKVKYTPDTSNSDVNATQVSTINMADRSCINDDRLIKQLLAPGMMAKVPRNLLTSGVIEVSEVYYLGWFKPTPLKVSQHLVRGSK